MRSLAERIPGSIAIKTFTAPDGERVSVVEFETLKSHRKGVSIPNIEKLRDSGWKGSVPNSVFR
jgi:hypothetical protein